MKSLNWVLLGLVLCTSSVAFANVELAKAKNCLACHSVDKKIVGPAFKDVAKKYAGDASAEAKLIAKVIKGGSGNWGAAAMPPNSQVSEADVKVLVKWVLSQK